jgi:hypothetical protein
MTAYGQFLTGILAGLACVAGLAVANAAVEWLSHSDAVGLILLAGVLAGLVGAMVWNARHWSDPR